MNKKGMTVYDDWAEMVTGMVLVVGLALALLSDSAIVTYIIITLCGFFIGRLYALRKAKIRFAFYMIVIGFLIGFILGVVLRSRGNVILTLVFFVIGIIYGVKLHQNMFFK